jgi:hypothetical protein
LESRGIDPVITRAAVDGQLVGGIGMEDGHRSAGAGDQDSPSADRKQIDRVVAGGAVDRDVVDLAVADARAERALEIDCHPGEREVGAGEIVDHDGVGTAEGVDIDPLDAVEVHRDASGVAGEKHARAVGRDVDGLVDIRAAEIKPIEAGLTLDRVAAVARVPDEHVITRAQ